MATAHMHSQQGWQMPSGVHGMQYHPQQEHELPHTSWSQGPAVTMAQSYTNPPLSMSNYSLGHSQPMTYGQHPSHAQHQHHSHQQPHHSHQQHQHSHQHQHQQHQVRAQSSADALHSAMNSGLPSPIHPISHSGVMAPMHQATNSPTHVASAAQSAQSMSLSSPQQGRFSQPVPHQVVGQQGIRGVLPRTNNEVSSPEETFDPEQDPQGSWPCKFCGRKYRHAKHLRRHHSRHTGETPYECNLCERKFGRSDVLKRHYHKCATRRGVPVGDHLEGQRGHPRRRNAARASGSGDAAEHGSPSSNGQSDMRNPMTNSTIPMEVQNQWPEVHH